MAVSMLLSACATSPMADDSAASERVNAPLTTSAPYGTAPNGVPFGFPLEPVTFAYPDDCPERAAGDVIVQADITAEGIAENVSILQTPDPCFTPPVLDAMARTRFQPIVIDGTAQGMTGVVNRFTFRAPTVVRSLPEPETAE